MKLATLKAGGRDGTLVVVSRDLGYCQPVPHIAPTLQAALDDWDGCLTELELTYAALNLGEQTKLSRHAMPFDPAACHSPLPRAYQWADGSAYVNHVALVRQARGASLPADFWTDPLIYQGGSDSFVGPRDAILAASEDWGIDFEAEVAVITGDVAIGAPPEECAAAIRLLMLVNDVSLRHLIPRELAKGFGFFQSKPASAFSPVAATPDELVADWRDGKVHRPLVVHHNERRFGQPNAGVDMVFSFPQLIAHAAKTRELEAGSIVGSGTVSNQQDGGPAASIAQGGVGYCCLAELRSVETLESGAPRTDFLHFGDRVRIEMFNSQEQSIFGAIDQIVRPSRDA